MIEYKILIDYPGYYTSTNILIYKVWHGISY